MPNHIENYIYLKGDQQKINQVLEDIKSDEYGIGTIDFNKVIPMPESLNIEAGSLTDRGLKAYSDFVSVYTLAGGITGLDILNIPKESEDAFRKRKPEITDEEWQLGKTAFRNQVKYGHSTWYEWCIDNWNTKWNAYGYEYGDNPESLASNNKIWFNTAWSAPIPVVSELSNKYPDIEFAIEWADEDIGSNCGRMVFKNGERIEEYFPETHKEAIEYACGIHGYDSPNDISLYLNASETGYINILFGDYQLIEVDGKKALFSNSRLTEEDIPKGMYCYDLREKDDGSGFATIEPVVRVNHGGTIITKEPIKFGKEGYIKLTDETCPNFLPVKDLTFEDFMNNNIEENTEGMVQNL